MGLQMMHGRPCASCCSSSSSSSSSWMMQAQPPKQSHHPLSARPNSSESLAVLALHLLLKRRRYDSRDTAATSASSSGVLQITESSKSSSLTKTKVDAERKALDDALDRSRKFDEPMPSWMDRSHTTSNLQYGLLMQNLHELETSLAGKDLVMLERGILVHMKQLGALKPFDASLSMATLDMLTQTADESGCALIDKIIKFDPETPLEEQDTQVIVRSGKSQERKLKRMRASEKRSRVSVKVSPRRSKKSRKSSSSQFISEWKHSPGRRRTIIREQSALLVTIKECANLEKIRENMLKEGEDVSYHRWAEAAGIDEAVLKSRLQAGYCSRERLLVTTEWLVKYIARTYTGMGTPFDDLLQAGKIGVLDGAEKFDSQKGCKFSTYVKYWIRKAMLALLAENSGVTQLPVHMPLQPFPTCFSVCLIFHVTNTPANELIMMEVQARMESIIRKVKEARRAVRYTEGRNPSDSEIAAMVGVSVANVRLARKCSRRVESLYAEIGIGLDAKFSEVIPDTSTEAADEAIFRRQLRERLLLVLDTLPAREGRVLKLRHGLEDGRCRSLEQIGAVYRVSKEWIRKIEKKAMAKLRNEDVRRQLSDFCGF